MAKELLVGIALGAVLQGSFVAAFGNAKRTIDTLSATGDKLKTRYESMGKAMERYGQSLGGRSLSRLSSQYEQVGRAIDGVRRKQEQLAASMARGVALKTARQESLGNLKESAAMGIAIGAPVFASIKQAANFESELRDIAITGNLSKKQEITLGAQIRKAALNTNQSTSAIIEGVNTLVAAGMDANKAGQYSALLGKVSTATNADMKDLAGMVYSMSETLGIKGDAAIKEAFNRAAFGGKLGRFELKDMAKALPEMTSAFAAKGIKGQDALTQIIASLEVGREGAGSGDEAVTNMRNWLAHMNSGTTADAYGKAGVKYQESMQKYVADGYSSYEASLMIANKFIDKKGKDFMAKWKQAGAKGDAEAQQRLMESFGLNEVFKDIQTINHLLSMRQGWDKYQSNKKDMGSQRALGTIDEDYLKRVDTANKAWEKFVGQISDVAITIGSVFLPAVNNTLASLGPMVTAFGSWAAQHPQVISGIVGLVGGMVALRTAVFGLKFLGNFMFLAPANGVATAWGVLTSRITIFRALLLGGTSRLSLLLQLFGVGSSAAGKLTSLLGGAGQMVLRLGRFLGGILLSGFRIAGQAASWMWGVLGNVFQMSLKLGRLLGGALFSGLRMAGQATLLLGRFLGGTLLSGLRLVGQAVLWLGRAFLMNPIGLAITAIALGAYLIYRYWDPIKKFFSGLWQQVKVAFNGGIGGITKLIINWSPVGLFYKAFAGFMKYFDVDLPANFTTAGSHIIDGLISGIESKLSAAKERVIAFGEDIKSWFSETLDIHSPSRVFIGFGDNIAMGAAIGIGRSAHLAGKASGKMAQQTADAASGVSIGSMAGIKSKLAETKGIVINAGQGIKNWLAEAISFNVPPVKSMVGRASAIPLGMGHSQQQDLVPPQRMANSSISPAGHYRLDDQLIEIKSKLAATKGFAIHVGQGIKSWLAEAISFNVPPVKSMVGRASAIPLGMGHSQQQDLVPPQRMANSSISPAGHYRLDDQLIEIKSKLAATKGFAIHVGQGIKSWLANSADGGLAAHKLQGDQREQTRHPLAEPIGHPGAKAVNQPHVLSGMTIQYSPTIHVASKQGDGIETQVKRGLQLSLQEFEAMLDRVMKQKSRRAYG